MAENLTDVEVAPANEREKNRPANEVAYRDWAVENSHLIALEALISLFGCREAHRIREEHAAMLTEGGSELLARQQKRREYQRELMRKRRAEMREGK